MPAEQGIGLDNHERLFPVPAGSREHDQAQPVGPRTRWTLHLTVKDHELLSHQRILGDEFSPGASQIVQCSHEEGAARWPRPLLYTLLDPTEGALELAGEQHVQSRHESPGAFTKRSEGRDAGKRSLMRGWYSGTQSNGKEMAPQNGYDRP